MRVSNSGHRLLLLLLLQKKNQVIKLERKGRSLRSDEGRHGAAKLEVPLSTVKFH